MSIQNTVLETTATTIFTAAGINGNVITTMYFCNRDSSTATFNLHLVPSGGTANVNNIAYSNKAVASNDTYIIDWEKLVLAPGEMIQASCNTGNAIVATVSTMGI